MLIKHNLLIIKMQSQGMSRETCCVVIYTKFLIHFSHCRLLRINPCIVQKIQINKNYSSNNMYCEVMLQFIFYVSQFLIFLCIKSWAQSVHYSVHIPYPKTMEKQKFTGIKITICKFFYLFNGQESTKWPADNCLQIMVCCGLSVCRQKKRDSLCNLSDGLKESKWVHTTS